MHSMPTSAQAAIETNSYACRSGDVPGALAGSFPQLHARCASSLQGPRCSRGWPFDLHDAAPRLVRCPTRWSCCSAPDAQPHVGGSHHARCGRCAARNETRIAKTYDVLTCPCCRFDQLESPTRTCTSMPSQVGTKQVCLLPDLRTRRTSRGRRKADLTVAEGVIAILPVLASTGPTSSTSSSRNQIPRVGRSRPLGDRAPWYFNEAH